MITDWLNLRSETVERTAPPPTNSRPTIPTRRGKKEWHSLKEVTSPGTPSRNTEAAQAYLVRPCDPARHSKTVLGRWTPSGQACKHLILDWSFQPGYARHRSRQPPVAALVQLVPLHPVHIQHRLTTQGMSEWKYPVTSSRGRMDGAWSRACWRVCVFACARGARGEVTPSDRAPICLATPEAQAKCEGSSQGVLVASHGRLSCLDGVDHSGAKISKLQTLLYLVNTATVWQHWNMGRRKGDC